MNNIIILDSNIFIFVLHTRQNGIFFVLCRRQKMVIFVLFIRQKEFVDEIS